MPDREGFDPTLDEARMFAPDWRMAKLDTGGRRRRGTVSAEWVGGRFLMPAYVMEDDPYRPELALWLEVPAGLVVGHGINSDKNVEGTLAEALRDALVRPTRGAARIPARLRVADHGMAAELRNAFGERFAIDVAPTPELDAIFEQFVQSMPHGDDKASYLEGGRVPEHVVARMFEAAALLYRAAPWKVASDDEILRMDIPSLGVRCASPQRTACSTQRKTVSQVEWKRLATSRHDSTFAQLARNQASAWVVCILPAAHGTASTVTPQRRQSTRRMA